MPLRLEIGPYERGSTDREGSDVRIFKRCGEEAEVKSDIEQSGVGMETRVTHIAYEA